MDKKGKLAARMSVRKNVEQLAHELYEKKENVNSSGLDDWLEAERIVAEWLKNREDAERTKEAQEKKMPHPGRVGRDDRKFDPTDSSPDRQ